MCVCVCCELVRRVVPFCLSFEKGASGFAGNLPDFWAGSVAPSQGLCLNRRVP